MFHPFTQRVLHRANLKWVIQPAFANIFLFPTSVGLNWGRSEVLPLNPGFTSLNIALNWIHEFLKWEIKLCFMTQSNQRTLYHLRAIQSVIGPPTNFSGEWYKLAPRNKFKGTEEGKHKVASYTWVHLFILLLNTVHLLPIMGQAYPRHGETTNK